MRLKNNPKAKDIISNSNMCIANPEQYKGTWKSSFSNNTPIYLEIGCGKGQFLTTLSTDNPSIFYLGIEQYESVLYSAVKKSKDFSESGIDNLRFLCVRAEYLMDYFEKGEVDKIFLNFSDPWPKKRHAKRRLTSDRFLPIYDNVLTSNALIEIKTDNENLFEFSMESISNYLGFEVIDYTKDLYDCPSLLKNNVPTEYETKFHSMGNPIYKIIAKHVS